MWYFTGIMYTPRLRHLFAQLNASTPAAAPPAAAAHCFAAPHAAAQPGSMFASCTFRCHADSGIAAASDGPAAPPPAAPAPPAAAAAAMWAAMASMAASVKRQP